MTLTSAAALTSAATLISATTLISAAIKSVTISCRDFLPRKICGILMISQTCRNDLTNIYLPRTSGRLKDRVSIIKFCPDVLIKICCDVSTNICRGTSRPVERNCARCFLKFLLWALWPFLNFIDRLIPFVIHGLVDCFSLCFETALNGAYLFSVLSSLLKKVVNALFGSCDDFLITDSQSMLESSSLNKISENSE